MAKHARQARAKTGLSALDPARRPRLHPVDPPEDLVFQEL
jgi:hypothetical protein